MFILKQKINLDILAESLRHFRKENRVTKKEVEYHLNICPSQYDMFENGDMYITIPMLDTLSNLYFVPTDDIIYSKAVKHDKDILKNGNTFNPLGY